MDDIARLEEANGIHEAALNAAAIIAQQAADAEQLRRYQERLDANGEDSQ